MLHACLEYLTTLFQVQVHRCAMRIEMERWWWKW